MVLPCPMTQLILIPINSYKRLVPGYLLQHTLHGQQQTEAPLLECRQQEDLVQELNLEVPTKRHTNPHSAIESMFQRRTLTELRITFSLLKAFRDIYSMTDEERDEAGLKIFQRIFTKQFRK